MMKAIASGLLSALLVSCSANQASPTDSNAVRQSQGATADSDSTNGNQSNADDTVASAGSTNSAGSTQNSSASDASMSSMTKPDGPARGECKGTLSYDPSGFQCAFQESKSNSVWKNEQYWNDLIHKMQNLDASWIGPGPAKKKGANNDLDYCPSVGAQYRLVHVSHFKLDAAAKVKLQFVMDDKGSVELWKNAEADKAVYVSEWTNSLITELPLEAGFYSLIATTVDDGASATSIIGSVLDSATGAILRQTEGGKNWCIFQVTPEVGIPDFLRANAVCRSCMVGDP